MRLATLIMATLALLVSAGNTVLILMHDKNAGDADARLERAVKKLGEDLAFCINTTHPSDPDVPLGAC